MSGVEISESVLARSVDDQTVLLDLDTGHCYVLNGIAAEMWSLLRQGEDPEAVVGRLLEDYDVEADVLRSDLDQLIQGLVRMGLARSGPAPPG